MEVVRVQLRSGPVNGELVDLEAPLDVELTVEVTRAVGFRLFESIGGAEPVTSDYVRRTGELHRYRLIQGEPAVMEWAGRIET
ncbi:MAG TPA: hypothetical protein VJT84_12345 [Gaiellaceae bacterium]|nr:hypothetical protein [Gaiellaceae bacterium]